MTGPPDGGLRPSPHPADQPTTQQDPHHHDQVDSDGNGHPDGACVMCDLVAATRRQLKARVAERDLVRCLWPARTLDLAGPHEAVPT
jgi:hypothetical protein